MPSTQPSPQTPKAVFLTGATGFLGSRLTRHLCQIGHDVHIVTRPSSSLNLLGDAAHQVTVHEYDGSVQALHKAMAIARPEVVFHLASLFLAQHQEGDVPRLIESNVLYGSQLLEAMSVHGIRHLVNTGTAWQHHLDRDYCPVNLYAATKQAFEAIVEYYVDAHALRAITLQLFDTYGPGDPRPKVLNLVRNAALRGEPLFMSPGEQLVDLVHIADIVDALMTAGTHVVAGTVRGHERYAVSSGAPIRLKDLVDCYQKVLGTPIPIRWGERPYRLREVMKPWSGGQTLPGWQPQITLEEGLRTLA